MSTISASNQKYLKAIWSLREWSDDPVTASALAARVGVRLSTVSDAVRRLTGLGLTTHTPYGAVELTAAGQRLAIAMVRRHRLIETFLVESLGYGWDQVHEEAENLEHAVSDFLIDRIDERLGFPVRDPHGDPIPRADGTIDAPAAVILTAVPMGTPVRVARISDDDPELLQFFEEHGIGIDTVLTLEQGAPFSGSLQVVIDAADAPLTLGTAATDAVHVRALGGAADE